MLKRIACPSCKGSGHEGGNTGSPRCLECVDGALDVTQPHADPVLFIPSAPMTSRALAQELREAETAAKRLGRTITIHDAYDRELTVEAWAEIHKAQIAIETAALNTQFKDRRPSANDWLLALGKEAKWAVRSGGIYALNNPNTPLYTIRAPYAIKPRREQPQEAAPPALATPIIVARAIESKHHRGLWMEQRDDTIQFKYQGVEEVYSLRDGSQVACSERGVFPSEITQFIRSWLPKAIAAFAQVEGHKPAA